MKKILTKLVGAVLGFTMALGVGVGITSNKKVNPVYAEDFSTVYNYANGPEGTGVWSLTEYDDQATYYLVPSGSTPSVATFSSIFTGKTITSDVVITINNGTYSSGTNPDSSTFKIFNSDDCSSQVTAAQSGTLATSKTYVDTIYTVSKANAILGFSNDLAIQITKPGKQIRLNSVTIEFGYTTSGEPVNSVSVSLDKTSIDIDMYVSTTATLTATAATTGSAEAGLSAVSSNPSVASVSTASPSSGVAFTVTANAVGEATITVTSTWDDQESASCTVTVTDTSPRLVNFKKVDSLLEGQRVLITTVADGSYYYLPSDTTSSSPTAVSCSYNSEIRRIVNVDAEMAFYVVSSSTKWVFKNADDKYLYVNNSGTGVRVGNTSDSFTVSAEENGFSMLSTNNSRYLGKYNSALDWRSYTSSNADNYKGNDGKSSGEYINFWVEAKPDQTITGATAAYTINTVTLTSTADSPTWSIVAGDTTAPGAAVTSGGVVSVTGAGVVKVKASHDDYEDAYHTITFTVKPEDPFIHPAKTSTSGYTGQNETLSFTYGNLESTLNVFSDDTDIVTVETPSYSAGNGTVRINFVAGGTAHVLFNDGSTELGSVTVTVTTSTVTITGMPSSKYLNNGSTLNLGALITVTPTGSFDADVNWSSSAPGVATVNSSGVVTGVSMGSAVITASPEDYPAGAVSCTVTVARVASAVFSTDIGDSNTSIDSDSTLKEDYGYAINSNIEFSGFAAVYPNANKAVKFGGSSTKGQITVGLKDGKVDGRQAYITKIIVSAMTWNTDETTISIADESFALTASFVDYDVEFDTNNVTSVAIEASASSKQRFRISSIQVVYEYVPYKDIIESNLSTISALKFNYTNIEDSYTYTNTAIRFGGAISKALWDQLEEESDIQGYGVLVAETSNLGGKTIVERYNEARPGAASVNAAITSICSTYSIGKKIVTAKEHPAVANAGEKSFLGIEDTGDYYIWTATKSFSSSEHTKDFNSVAFILIDGDIVFLQEVTSISPKDIAERDHILFGGTPAGTALEFLSLHDNFD